MPTAGVGGGGGGEGLTALVGPDQEKMRVTSLDHWTLNLLQPLGRDVVARRGIKRTCTLGGGTFSLLFSGVTARVNGLFEVSEELGK